MVRPLDSKTEEHILDAAYKVILRHGKAGTRMQEIADEAGVNKALLHYYFRTKDKIYTSVVRKVVRQFLGTLLRTIDFEAPVNELIKKFIRGHIASIQKNQMLFQFFFSEIWLNREEVVPVFKEIISDSRGSIPDLFTARINRGIYEKEIRPVDPHHLLINIISLDVFFFLASPIFTSIMNLSPEMMDKMTAERADQAADTIWESIRYRREES